MLNLVNCGPEEFKKRIKDRVVFIYGAGRTLESNMANYFKDADIGCVIDNDSTKWGTVSKYGRQFEIHGLDYLIDYSKKSDLKKAVLFITSQFYAAEIIKELDGIPELDGLECYLHFWIRNTREELIDFSFTQGERRIPKTIHYIWFGKKELPESFLSNIETWKKYNPDYEIVRWDEDNYDVNKTEFIKEAYEAQKWSKVANFVRLDVLYEYGGIYLDTDVEVIKNFDCLLNDECFFCLGNQDSVNNGCGLGAVPGNEMIKGMLGEFEGLHFDVSKGGVGMRSAHNFMDPVVKRKGFVMENRYQKIDGAVLYPKEVLSPLSFGNMEDFFCERTLSIHHEFGSWKSDKEKNGTQLLLQLYEERINGDGKTSQRND